MCRAPKARQLAYTGHLPLALPGDIAKAKGAGFDRHLAKPPSLEEIETVLAKADRSLLAT